MPPYKLARALPDRVLELAIWSSFILHLALLLLIPGPGGVEASAPLSVTIALRPPEPSPVPAEEIETVPAPEEPSVPDAPAEKTPPKPVPPEPAQLPPPVPEAPAPAEPVPTPVPPSEEIVALSAPEPRGVEGDGTRTEAERIEELLRRTEESLARPEDHERYLVRDVFNRVKRALDDAHDRSPKHRKLGTVDKTRKSCVLSFRIDAEGYIFDLGLETPPGVRTALDIGALRAAIYAINPLPAPPAGMRTPVERTFEFTFP